MIDRKHRRKSLRFVFLLIIAGSAFQNAPFIPSKTVLPFFRDFPKNRIHLFGLFFLRFVRAAIVVIRVILWIKESSASLTFLPIASRKQKRDIADSPFLPPVECCKSHTGQMNFMGHSTNTIQTNVIQTEKAKHVHCNKHHAKEP